MILIINFKKMNNISNFYKLEKLQPELDFVDIRLDTDNQLFIDPRLIENQRTYHTEQIQHRIEAISAELIKRVKTKDTQKIYYLLSGVKEPNQPKLGHAFSEPRGNSVASKLKP